jgi:hypothetical protein
MIKNYEVRQIISFDEERMSITVIVRDAILPKQAKKRISFIIKEVTDLTAKEKLAFFDWIKNPSKRKMGFCWLQGWIPSSRRTIEGFLCERADIHGSFGTLVEHE